jgi:hypothetical protein
MIHPLHATSRGFLARGGLPALGIVSRGLLRAPVIGHPPQGGGGGGARGYPARRLPQARRGAFEARPTVPAQSAIREALAKALESARNASDKAALIANNGVVLERAERFKLPDAAAAKVKSANSVAELFESAALAKSRSIIAIDLDDDDALLALGLTDPRLII